MKNLIVAQKWLLATVMAVGLYSCQSDSVEHNAQEAKIPYNVPVTLSFGASVSTETSDESRALFGLREATSNGVQVVNPYLDLDQFHDPAGMDVNLIFVRTDAAGANVPVSIVTTKLKPEDAYHNATAPISPIPQRNPRLERYLRTDPGTGNTVTLAEGTDLSQGTWKFAIYAGAGLPQRNTVLGLDNQLLIDPNHMSQIDPGGDAASDNNIGRLYLNNRNNITPVDVNGTKANVAVPFFSEWKDITPDMFVRTGNTPQDMKLDLGRVTLRPQGMLLRIQVRNRDFSNLKLAGFRLLTNSLSFRGEYDFNSDMLRANAQKANGDLNELYVPRNARNQLWNDSVRMRAYPNYADFLLPQTEAEDLAQGADSKYYLVWAMPRPDDTDPTQSRKGILHVMCYDANRYADEYNRAKASAADANDLTWIVPRALIRKPALTTFFDAGQFPLSSGKVNGKFYRLHGVLTTPYNFLDFMVNDNSNDFVTRSDLNSVTLAQGERVADQQDWAGIFPVKLPDNPGLFNDQYFDHYYMGINELAGQMFNSNRWGYVDNNANNAYYSTSGAPNATVTAYFIISNDDTVENPLGSDRSKAGRSNNKQRVRVPYQMHIPKMVNGRIVENTNVEEMDMHFSTISYGNFHYALVGWDAAGQIYLSGTVYHAVGGEVQATSRYLGPAAHRVYTRDWRNGGRDALNWDNRRPWDISAYYFARSGEANPRLDIITETDDTWRTLSSLGGHQVDGTTVGRGNHAAYWSADGNWVYLYYTGAINRVTPGSGYGAPGTVTSTIGAPNRVAYSATQTPAAVVRKFANTPQGKGRP